MPLAGEPRAGRAIDRKPARNRALAACRRVHLDAAFISTTNMSWSAGTGQARASPPTMGASGRHHSDRRHDDGQPEQPPGSRPGIDAKRRRPDHPPASHEQQSHRRCDGRAHPSPADDDRDNGAGGEHRHKEPHHRTHRCRATVEQTKPICRPDELIARTAGLAAVGPVGERHSHPDDEQDNQRRLEYSLPVRQTTATAATLQRRARRWFRRHR